ncbi:MAG: ferrous iron transport protein A [Firmicutes bacterium]|nr:ferrous iron transport protein A [Bacillota bacterium]
MNNATPLSQLPPTPVTEARPLDKLQSMQAAIVVEVDAADEDAQRLKAMGICAGRRVQLVRVGDPLIVRVLGSRVGLSARLARCVSVEPCEVCGPRIVLQQPDPPVS